MLDDHLWWPFCSALKPGEQALGPLPDAGDVHGSWLAGVRQTPLLLGKAPLRSAHNFGWAAAFRNVFSSTSARQNTPWMQALRDARQISAATSHALAQGHVSTKARRSGSWHTQGRLRILLEVHATYVSSSQTDKHVLSELFNHPRH